MLATLLLGLCAQTLPPRAPLKLGDVAPEFTLPSTGGGMVTLSGFRGKAPVVVTFFPAAFSAPSARELLAYQARLARFLTHGVNVLGISTDNTPAQREFAARLNVSFPLLSDFTDRGVARAYGVLAEKLGVANPATFVVDREGRIVFMQGGNAAADAVAVENACSRLFR